MATYKHIRSNVDSKRPTTSLADGQIAINTNVASPGVFFKDSAGTGIVKVGPVHVGTTAPNSTPGAGGSTGNSIGEQWLDTNLTPAQLKVWNGSAWVQVVADELPVSKLQNGSAYQLIQTDAAGTGVEWTDNIDVPGTLAVTSTATFDSTATFSSIASHPLGTAAAPTITFTGDTDTGVFSPGVNQVALSTAGTSRLHVAADGKIGVGTSSPSVKLDVDGDVNIATSGEFRVAGTKVLDATSLGSAVVSSSLTSVGTIGTGVWNGTALTSAYIGADAIDGTKIADDSINSEHYVDGSIDTAHIADSQITSAKIADDSINSEHYVDGSIDTAHIADSQITSAKIADSQITSAKIADDSINSEHYVDGSIDTAHIADSQITSAKILDGTIVDADVNASAAIAGTKISPDFGSQAVTTTGLISADGKVSFPLGTEALPSLYPGSDTNTGIYSPGADQLALSTDGTERLRIDSSGNVGIGTSGPQVLTHLSTSTDTQLRVESTSASGTNEAAVQLIRGSNQSAIKNQAGGLEFFVQGLTNEVARLDSSGNVGIGTTSVASNFKVEIQDSGTTGINIRNTNDSTNDTRRIAFSQGSGNLTSLNTVADIQAVTTGTGSLTGDIFFRTNGGNSLSERIRIDSSGRLLVGTSSAATIGQAQYGFMRTVGGTSTTYGVLSIGRNTAASSGIAANSSLGTISFTDSVGAEFGQITCFTGSTTSTNDYPGELRFSTTADGASSPTERMRIDSRGQSLFLSDGTPSTDFMLATQGGTSDSNKILSMRRSATAGSVGTGSEVCVVRRNGDLDNTNNSYGSLSDIKLKENIIDANSQWDDLKALQVRNYNFKVETGNQTHTQLGLIAQEVELVSPGLVKTTPDLDDNDIDLGTTTKSVNYSVLYMKAVKALQEAMTRIEALEQRLTDAGIA